MSGFDANVLSTKPIIREAASMNNDGGAGNLGYMAQGDKDGEKKQQHKDESIFDKKQEGDVFAYQKYIKIPEDEEFSFSKYISELIQSLKSLFIRR